MVRVCILARLICLSHAEGVAGGIGADGGGVTLKRRRDVECQWWQGDQYRAVSLVQQISVANLSCADVYAGVAMARTLLTNVGLALNFDSEQSGQWAY